MFPFTPHTTLRLNFVRAVPCLKGDYLKGEMSKGKTEKEEIIKREDLLRTIKDEG